MNLFYYSGADFAGMSGSGSTMFGVFSEQKDWISLSETMSNLDGHVLFVNPLETVTKSALQFS